MKKIIVIFLLSLCMISPALAETVTIASTAEALPAGSVMDWDGGAKAFDFVQTAYNFRVEPFLMVGDVYVPLEDANAYFPSMSVKGFSSNHGTYIKFYVSLSGIPADFYDTVGNFGYRIVMPEDASLRDADVRSAGKSVSLKDDIRIDYSDLESNGYTIDSVDGNYVYIGFAGFAGSEDLSFDPTIQLQTADAQNLGDTWINEGSVNQNNRADTTSNEQGNSGGQRFGLLRFNISSVPQGQAVDDAKFCWYLSSNPLLNSAGYWVSAHHLFMNYTCGATLWNESCPTWTLRPNSTLAQYSPSAMQSINITGASALGWYCWNVTDSVARSYFMGFKNTSLYMIANISLGSPATALAFRTKEHATASTRPYLNVTYHDVSIPQWSLNSTNGTVIGNEPVLHSVYWTDLDALSMFIFSSNITGVWLNDTAQPFINGWANATKTTPSFGVVGWQVFANDTSNNWNSTPVFAYQVFALNLTAVYPSEVNETGNYSVLAFYEYNDSEIANATLVICYTFTTVACDVMTEGAGYYYWNFTYDHDVGGIVQFNITASYNAYPNISTTFYITFFDANVGVRFWEDLNMTQHYFNEFLWVYAKPRCDLYNQLLYLGLVDVCNHTAYHAKYLSGVANLSIWSPNTYDLYIVDGTVSWSCNTCEPSVVGYNYWMKFDAITVSTAGATVRDYFWNTTVAGQYPFFGNFEWNFWLSVVGIFILMGVAVFCAYITENAIATLFIILLSYIVLKLFGILTGQIFFGLF